MRRFKTGLLHKPDRIHRKRQVLKPASHLQQLVLTLALFIAVCLSLFPASNSAQADTLKWTVVDTPSAQNNIVLSPSEVNAIAIDRDGRTFYAIDIPNGKVFKSVNSGIGWDNITTILTNAGAVMPAWHIALAPDNPNFVAIVTSTAAAPRRVFVSVDGGNNWHDTNCTATSNISALDVSPNRNGYNVMVGTRTGAGNGDILTYRAVGMDNWASQGFIGDVLSARFSPNYAADASLVIVAARATGTTINLGIHDPAANTTNWSTWSPVEVTTGGAGTSPTSANIISADLELPIDFSGQAPSLRRFYVSTDAPVPNAGIYRFDDTAGYLLMPAASTKRISSIAYFGTYASGKLLAGEVTGNPNSAQVNTWFTDAPTTCPIPCWYQAKKPPTGAAGTDACASSGYGNAKVAWSADGSVAYAATASSLSLIPGPNWHTPYLTGEDFDESAFSISRDNGQLWNQLSLIDTGISFLSDVAVSANSDTLYLASINSHAGCNGFDSLWRGHGQSTYKTWERVLCLTATTNYTLVRMNQAKPQSVFLGICSTANLYASLDGGQSWQNIFPGINVTDFAVSQGKTALQIYVLENNYVCRAEGSFQAWQWKQKMDTGLATGHSINVSPNGIITVGDAGEGKVAFSADNGNQFISLPPVPAPGNIHAVADPRITKYIVIYAGSDSPGGNIDAWVVGATQNWIDMGAPQRSTYGLAQGGTLYGAWSKGGNSGVNRTLNPESLAATFVEWDNLTAGLPAGVVFTREPSSLKISGSVDLWAIDNRPYTANTGRLWVFYDCFGVGPQITTPPSRELLLAAPTPIAPAANAIMPIDHDKGTIADIVFRWRHPTQARKYELLVAKDKEFSQLVTQQPIIPDSPLMPTWTLSAKEIALEPTSTYYWKVRVTRDATSEPAEGQWSEIIPFSIAAAPEKELSAPGPELLTPANGETMVNQSPSFTWQPVSGANKYELTLAKDRNLKQPIIRAQISGTAYQYDGTLEPGRSYSWQVKVIEPLVSQPSPLFSFTVSPEPAKPQQKTDGIPQTVNIVTLLWIAIPLLIVIIAIIWLIAARNRSYR